MVKLIPPGNYPALCREDVQLQPMFPVADADRLQPFNCRIGAVQAHTTTKNHNLSSGHSPAPVHECVLASDGSQPVILRRSSGDNTCIYTVNVNLCFNWAKPMKNLSR